MAQSIRAANPYTTHLPVLVGLGRLAKIKRVLELGFGEYSTQAFLDMQAYPDLVKLHSIEDNPAWIEKARTIGDARYTLAQVLDFSPSSLSGLDLSRFDLIFIDNSTSWIVRAKTIKWVTDHLTSNNIIIIHDYEIEAYQMAARGIPKSFTIDSVNPYTGILWNGVVLDKRKLKELNALIAQFSMSISLEDRQSWINMLNEEL